jgi:hypothetical protein
MNSSSDTDLALQHTSGNELYPGIFSQTHVIY